MSLHTQSSPVPPLLAESRGGAVFLVILAPLGPLLMALSLFAMPAKLSDGIPAMAASMAAEPVATQWAVLFISLFVCLPAGTLLLGIAALIAARAGRLPLWTASLLPASMPLVLAVGFAESVQAVSDNALAATWLVVAVAYGAAAMPYATRSRSAVPPAPWPSRRGCAELGRSS